MACLPEDADLRCQRALKNLLNKDGMQPAHVFCNMWNMLAGVNVPPGATALGHVGCAIGHLPLAISAFCVGHGIYCQIPAADMDVTGTPCQDFSGCGNGQADQGPQMAIF